GRGPLRGCRLLDRARRRECLVMRFFNVGSSLSIILLLMIMLPRVEAQTAAVSGSPANGNIAYTAVLDKNTPTERRAIFVYPGHGRLTFPYGPVGKDSDSAPAFSPNGKSLAFIRHVWTTQTTSEWVIM